MNITPDFVATRANISKELAEKLLEGVDKIALTELLRNGSTVEAVVEKRRMNLIGSLRNLGFNVSGGRRGGNIYRILDWADPRDEPTFDVLNFRPFQTENLKRVQSLPKLTSKQADVDKYFYPLWGALGQSTNPDESHEKSILQMFCYTIANNQAYLYEKGGRLGIIIQRFSSKPVMKLIPITLTFDETVEAANLLSTVSFRAVKILNIPNDWEASVRELGWSVEKNAEAIYDLDRFANKPQTWMNTRALEGLRRSRKDTAFLEITEGDELISQVIEEWRKVNEPKQRQLAISRDYLSFMIGLRTKMTFLSMREGSPVGIHIVDPVCGPLADQVVCQVTEKSLNYRSSPGGRSGTSDYNLWATSVSLLSKGYKLFNVGHIHGSEPGLAERKLRLADNVLYVKDVTVPRHPFFTNKDTATESDE